MWSTFAGLAGTLTLDRLGRRLASAVGWCTIAAISAGCGHGTTPPPPPPPTALLFDVHMQPQPAIAPPFQGTGAHFDPPVEMEGRGGSSVMSTTSTLDLAAADFRTTWQNSHVIPSGSTATFLPDWPDAAAPPEGLAFCCYRFQLGASAGGLRQTLGLRWDPEHRLADVSTQCCIGLSDWTRNAWEWFAGPADGTLTMESLAPFIGPNGETLVMMVVMGTSQATLEGLTVGAPEQRGGGLIPAPKGASSLASRYVSADRSVSVFPPAFDLTPQLPPIRDQGQLGSCTAFACGDSAFGFALNHLYAANGWNMSNNLNMIAPLYLYVETGVSEGQFLTPPTCPDEGRFLSGVLDFLKTNGAPMEGHAGYVSPFCDHDWTADALTDVPLLKITDFTFFQGQTAATVNNIKTELVTNGRPVVIGLLVDQAFVDYQPGQVWHFIGPALGGHAVAVVGYDDTLQAFKIRNQWSTFWGDAGYAFLSYNEFSGATASQLQECYAMTATFNQAVLDRFVPNSLQPPANVVASDGTFTDHVHITWSAANGATSYKVFRSPTATGTFTQIGTPTGTQFDDPQNVTAASFYAVRSSSSSGDSAPSTADAGHASVAAPTGVAASDGTLTDKVHVTWSAVTGAASYKVFRASSSTGTFTQIGTAATAQFDDPQSVTTVLFYKVKTTVAAGDSALSAADGGNAGLAAPTGVAATDGSLSDRVRITWNPVSTATSYKIFRAATDGGTYSQLGTATATTFDDVIGGTTPFFYRVKASKTGGDSGLSASNSGFAGVAAPANVQASDGAFPGKIQVTWNAVTGATGYKILRSTTLTGTLTQIGTTTTATLFDDPQTGSAPLFYAVKAVAAAGDSAPSAVNGGQILGPPALTATDGTLSDRIRVSWPAATGAVNYKVFRASSQTGTFSLILTTALLTFDQTSSTAAPFFFKVQASNANGDSAFSNTDAGFVGQAAPTAVQASDGTFAGHVHITWTAASGATSYKILRSTTANGSYSQVGTTAATQFDDSAAAGTTFFYKLRATGSLGDSYFSAIDSGFSQ